MRHLHITSGFCSSLHREASELVMHLDSTQATAPNSQNTSRPLRRHPSHVILILSNELDIAGSVGHWGDAPYAKEYAELLSAITKRLVAFDSERVYLGNAGFGEGLGGQIFDDHTYYGWYQVVNRHLSQQMLVCPRCHLAHTVEPYS